MWSNTTRKKDNDICNDTTMTKATMTLRAPEVQSARDITVQRQRQGQSREEDSKREERDSNLLNILGQDYL